MASPRRSHPRTPGVRDATKPSAAQRAEWALQRGARVVFATIVVASLLGLFGQGPFSRATADVDGVRTRYERFVRHEAELVVEATPAGEELALHVHGIIEADAMLESSPAPLRERITEHGRELSFSATPGVPSFVTLRWQPATPGVRRGWIAVEGTQLDVWFFVYP